MKKVLKYDSSYRVISGDGIEILDTLPAGIYELKAAKNEGFWFEKMALEKFEGKVYGDQDRITNKVVARFDAISGRNLGVLLSGKKGTGKSLFAKNLAVKMSEKLPVIIVKVNYGVGMLSTIAGVQGKAMVVFDEFEKMFRAECDGGSSQDDDIREQEKALSFFDGVETRQEKLLVLTVNEPTSLSKYLLGRPGRIYYHFRMGTPTVEEIEEYLRDNLSDDVKDNRAQLAGRLAAMSVSWDALSAVATELNCGSAIDETMADLNLRTDSMNTTYIIRARYDDGDTESSPVSLADLAPRGERDDITMVFDRRVSPAKFKLDRIWTKVTFKVADIVPSVSGFVLEKFEQDPPEDVDDKPVPDAPKIESLIIERRRSAEDLMYSAYKSGVMSYL